MAEQNPDTEEENSTKENEILAINSFDEMGLRSEVLLSIQDHGYTTPNDHQSKAIPACMTGKDVVLKDSAGKGKTVAVVISLMNSLDLSLTKCQYIHLTPYRECSKWTLKVYHSIGTHLNFTSHACIGGTRVRDEIETLKGGVQILVSTPGRLLDMLQRQALDTSSLRGVAVDEIHDIVDYKGMDQPTLDIFKILKQKVQVIVVSSSISAASKSVIDAITNQPIYICSY